MEANALKKIEEILRPQLKRRLYAVHMTAQVKSEIMEPFLEEHLLYMIKLENAGKLFASGPFVTDAMIGNGLAIFNTTSKEDAEELIKQEPFTREGFRSYEIHEWELREGRMIITLDASKSSFGLAQA